MRTNRSTTVHVQSGERANGSASQLSKWVRLVLIALIVYVGCNLAYGFGKWLARWRHVNRPIVAQQVDATDLGPAAVALPLAGPWVFGDLEWKLRSKDIDAAELEKLFTSMAATPVGEDVSQLPEADSTLLGVIQALNVRPNERNGNQVYRLDRPDLRMQLVTCTKGQQTRTVAFVIAYRQVGTSWKVYEFDPGASQMDATTTASHLLPLPSGARRDSGRFSENGQLLLEMISLDTTGEQLLSGWKQNGWEVRKNHVSRPTDFSYLCRRGDEVIYAWSADPQDALLNLMLVRTPNGSDTTSRFEPGASAAQLIE